MLEVDIVDIGRLKGKNSFYIKQRESFRAKYFEGFLYIEEIQIIW